LVRSVKQVGPGRRLKIVGANRVLLGNRRTFLVLVSLLVLAGFPSVADVRGNARVVDGDTLAIRDTRVRLHGIDCPEQKQMWLLHGEPWSCGEAASAALREIIGDHPVVCRGNKKDRYKRLIAVCFIKQRNLNRAMVRNRWALAYRKYSLDYVRDEIEAKENERGIWKAKFLPPWEWRRDQRAKQQQ
jgi:endonuclease YncB( thermonuclease family)